MPHRALPDELKLFAQEVFNYVNNFHAASEFVICSREVTSIFFHIISRFLAELEHLLMTSFTKYMRAEMDMRYAKDSYWEEDLRKALACKGYRRMHRRNGHF
jgi:hypothetical protein